MGFWKRLSGRVREFVGSLKPVKPFVKLALAFPSGTNLKAPAWQALGLDSEFCPDCGNQIFTKQENKCSCGWGKTLLKQGEQLIEVKNESHNPKSRIEENR